MRCGVRPHPHVSEQVVSLITWRPQGWERRLSLRVDSRSQRSRCFHAGTFVARDNKLAISVQTPFLRFRQCGSCRPQVISFCGRVGRIASRARQGGRTEEKENFESNGCARRAHVVRSSALGRRPTRGGESARTRWSCGGSARPPNFQARRSHGRAHWQKETALWARWGAHRERVEQTRRQRLGVARRSANTHGIARCIPVFWVWGGR